MEVECIACCSSGWWCRGCCGYKKVEGMKKVGLDEELINNIYERQFGSCSKAVVPCYVCNMMGERSIPVSWKNRANIKYDLGYWRGG